MEPFREKIRNLSILLREFVMDTQGFVDALPR